MIVQTLHTPVRSDLRRLRNPVTGKFLHLSTDRDVAGTAYAWSGTIHQARALKARATAKGEAFPYVLTAMDTPKDGGGDAVYL